ncbi:CTP synthase [Acerihabitans sp. KWT182]|uniref:CTP synthase (glutamine hydrolyzing) n=1 Tax=Acerihabitans sp. KWT182 TaxID=3157919 RepID=A0AAU7QF73_9GAMM
MSDTIRLAIVGDYRADAVAHQAILPAIELAAAHLNVKVNGNWISTPDLGDLADIKQSDAVWVVPGSPYKNDKGVFAAIRWARENRLPFLGSCGGFQYAIVEYARNVLGWRDAAHAETDQAGRMVIMPLSCSLIEQHGEVVFTPGSRIAKAYNQLTADEGYHCSFGVNPDFISALVGKNLRMTSHDHAGDVRGMELIDHPFFVATLFQSERAALTGRLSPLVVEWIRTAARGHHTVAAHIH